MELAQGSAWVAEHRESALVLELGMELAQEQEYQEQVASVPAQSEVEEQE